MLSRISTCLLLCLIYTNISFAAAEAKSEEQSWWSTVPSLSSFFVIGCASPTPEAQQYYDIQTQEAQKNYAEMLNRDEQYARALKAQLLQDESHNDKRNPDEPQETGDTLLGNTYDTLGEKEALMEQDPLAAARDLADAAPEAEEKSNYTFNIGHNDSYTDRPFDTIGQAEAGLRKLGAPEGSEYILGLNFSAMAGGEGGISKKSFKSWLDIFSTMIFCKRLLREESPESLVEILRNPEYSRGHLGHMHEIGNIRFSATGPRWYVEIRGLSTVEQTISFAKKILRGVENPHTINHLTSKVGRLNHEELLKLQEGYTLLLGATVFGRDFDEHDIENNFAACLPAVTFNGLDVGQKQKLDGSHRAFCTAFYTNFSEQLNDVNSFLSELDPSISREKEDEEIRNYFSTITPQVAAEVKQYIIESDIISILQSALFKS